jgi:hypothetical protein
VGVVTWLHGYARRRLLGAGSVYHRVFLLSRTRFCLKQDISPGDLLALLSGGPSEVTKEVSQLRSQADDGMASAGQEWEEVFQTCVPMRRTTNFVGYGRCCSYGPMVALR